jgi:hypothetical protein
VETQENPINTLQVETHCISKMIGYKKEMLFAYGCKKKLVKYDIFNNENAIKTYATEDHIRGLKLVKREEDKPVLIISLENGTLKLLDFDLRALRSIMTPHPNEKVI